MPNYLFRPLVRQTKKLDVSTIRSFAEAFDVSFTAAAIRLVEADLEPSMLVCHGRNGRRWFTRSKSIPERWYPQRELDHESFAFDIQFGFAQETLSPKKMGADAWFDRTGADHFEVKEQTVRIGRNETLTLLLFHDGRMLEETDTRRAWR
ncbi:hypothetical protein [Cereibacter sphaeroides]|nr:hypothetical protein [Cereibacter sphaeroides]